jgi:DNA polymerase-1
VFGFFSMLAPLLKEEKPTHVVAAFDVKAKTFRHDMYAEYKGTRKPSPPELHEQIGYIKEMLSAAGIKTSELAGYEADDILGTLAKQFKTQGEVIIVSGDRDILQLVDDSVTVFHNKQRNDVIRYTPALLAEEGFTPAQIIEYKSLAGDHSDNIPGVKGIGEKGAKDLLEKYGDLDGVYANIEELKGKLKENLVNDKANAYLSKTLATINVNVPLSLSASETAFNGKLNGNLLTKLKELEISALTSRFSFDNNTEVPVSEEVPKIVAKRVNLHEKDIKKTLSANKDAIALKALDEGLEIATSAEEYFVIDYDRSLFGVGLTQETVYEILKPFLANDKIKKYIYDAKSFFKAFGAAVGSIVNYDDLMLSSYLLSGGRNQKEYAESASAIFAASESARKKLKERGLLSLYTDIELPLIEVLLSCENEGINIDREALKEMSANIAAQIKQAEQEIYREAGKEFNISSNKQLADVLFVDLKLPEGKKTKTGYSVAVEVLDNLDAPIVKFIKKYRFLSKLQGTYLTGLQPLIDESGKLHTTFNQALTHTGRLSSERPNLQNIPNRSEEGREIRKMFVPSNGNVFVSADYSQIELRLLAVMSGDAELLNAYKNGIDIHILTASKIHGVPLNAVTKGMRTSAKAVNFGIVYGISAHGLSEQIGVGHYEAQRFIDAYFDAYPGIRTFMQKTVQEAERDGFVKTLFGRIANFSEIKSYDRQTRESAKRAAMNMPVQGTAADICKIAMLKVYNALKSGGYKAKLILQIHDELLVDCPIDEAEKVKALLKTEMEAAVSLIVPLIAETKSGNNWFI